MATLTVILGLCGSGKTWLADRVVAASKFDEAFFKNGAQFEALVTELRRGSDCVVVEVEYCREWNRGPFISAVQAAVQGVKINWLCIENDLYRANKNCRERSNKGDPETHVRINQDLSRTYSYPDGAVILKMWTKQC